MRRLDADPAASAAAPKLHALQGPSPANTPTWRREPYRLFFPLGAAVALSGVVPWLLYALGLSASYPRDGHAITEVQGFLTCFAIGFLLTFVPRRLKRAFPAVWEQAPLVVGCLLVPATALAGFPRFAHAAWAATLLMLVIFAARRMIPAVRARIFPTAFAWIPLSLVVAAGGALLAAFSTSPRLLLLGTSLVWQGLFGGLVIGVGVLMLPVMTRSAQWPSTSGPRWEWLLHLTLAAAFYASFPLEVLGSARGAMGLRGATAFVALVGLGRLWRYPNMLGLHRRVAWLATWLVPMGYLGAALWPAQRVGLLHLTFIGGFGLITFAIGNHVLVAHTGKHALLALSPKRIAVFALCVLAACAARVLVTLDPGRFRLWLGAAAVLFLIGTVSWLSWILPRLRQEQGADRCQTPRRAA